MKNGLAGFSTENDWPKIGQGLVSGQKLDGYLITATCVMDRTQGLLGVEIKVWRWCTEKSS